MMEENTSFLNDRDRVTIKQVEDLFAEVDKSVERLKKVTGIRCPEGCGICCSKASVETTPIEMLPLAAELWRTGEAGMWLDAIDRAADPGKCVFFKADPFRPGNGRCGVYRLRPLICRLFGFFTARDKHGRYVYGGCREIRRRYPGTHHKAVKLIDEGVHPSSVTDYTIRIIGMGSDLGRKMVPVNTAAMIALEKIGFELSKREWV